MDYDRDALRQGQRDAIDTIVDRFRRAESKTAVVLPTRYGKSDVARVASLYLWDEGEMSCALALSPNEFLRDQLGSTSKWNEATARYHIHTKQPPTLAKVLQRVSVRPNKNGEMFLSATIQLIQRNLDAVYVPWVEDEIRRTGLRPTVWLDESHLSSMGNEYGQVVVRLSRAGAHVVLLTATPERKDGECIPGFEFKTVAIEDIKVARTRPDAKVEYVWVDIFEGQRTTNRLKAHHETKFSEAWTENVLCKINHIPFDVDLSAIDGSWTGMLSQLPVSTTREQIGKIVRHPTVIGEGVRRSLIEFDRLRKIHSDIAIIVYVGNDTGKEEVSTNEHAKKVREEYRQQRPGLNVAIATSSVEGAKNTIEDFAGGLHDVLIVKQMASLGIDIERLKIGVDLSPTRTYASYIQRLMRPATPYDGLLICSHISPADVISKAHFDKCVRDEGGEASASDLTLIDSYLKQREESTKRVLTIDGVADAEFSDSSGNRALGVYWLRTMRFMAHLGPSLQKVASAAEIANAMARSEMDEDAEDGASTVTDTSTDAAVLRAEINDLARDFTKLYVFKRNGSYDQGLWVTTHRRLFNDAYSNVSGWPRKPSGQFEELTYVSDLVLLTQVRDYVGLALQAEQE